MKKPYIHSEKVHNTRAPEVVVPIIQELFQVNSVLDVGCGLGTWLKVFIQKNVPIENVLGLDGSYINYDQLVINRKNFKEVDLKKPFELSQKFDLAICLEVAEHLPETSANDLVRSLCNHSDTVIFSAAIPGQVGQNHINEQWPNYWKELFLKHGFSRRDLIRPKIWKNENVDIWYRQNMFVFTKTSDEEFDESILLAEIHPQLWASKIDEINSLTHEIDDFHKGKAGVERSFKALKMAIKNKFFLRE